MLNFNDTELIGNYFTYHPPATPKRIEQHERINHAAKVFAQQILPLIDNPQAQYTLFTLIQQARMLANQEVTIQEITSVEQCECKEPTVVLSIDADEDLAMEVLETLIHETKTPG